MAGSLPVSGNIETKSFPFLIAQLHQSNATGSLKVEGPSYQKALYLRGGRVLFGSSNDPRDQLGAILIESGKVTPAQLEDINTKVGPGNPLAKVLSESGLVTQQELGEAARAKVERILSDILTYAEGTFDFEDGVLPKGAVDLKLSTEQLLLSAVRRIEDRAFVLGHLHDIEVVLQPTPALNAGVLEMLQDAAVLARAFDGHCTLKDAIHRTRLDEFDGAKIACALIFLGCLAPAGAAAGEGGKDQDLAFFVPEGSNAELDLGQTARMAFNTGTEAEPPPARPPAPAPKAPAPPPPMPKPEVVKVVEPPPVPATIIMPAPPPPVPAMPAPPPVPATVIMPSPVFTPPPVAVPPPVPEVAPEPPKYQPSPSSSSSKLPLIPPPPRKPTEPSIPKISPPTAEEREALDALLHSRPGGGPLQPGGSRPTTSRQPGYEPKFGAAAGRPMAHPHGHSRALLWIFIVILIVGGGSGAVWWFVLGAPGWKTKPSPSVPITATTPVPQPTVAASVEPTPAVSPTSEAAPSSTVVPATLAPETTPPPAQATPTLKPVATPPTQAGGTAEARRALRAGQLREAGRGFNAHLASVSAQSFSIQILVACADETIAKAVGVTDSPELFILPVNLKGRACYRLCWGVYADQAQAAAAIRTIPEYFRQGGTTPRAVPITALR